MSYSDQPPPPPQYGAPPPPPGGMPAQNHPRAVITLVLGILSLLCFGLLAGIPAIILGRGALREINEAPGQYSGRGMVMAGFVCGIIGTAWSAIWLVIYVLLLAGN